jgi:C-8 sterol isomerase
LEEEVDEKGAHCLIARRTVRVVGRDKGARDAIILVSVPSSWLPARQKYRWYVFEPEFLHELAKDAIASASSPNATDEMITHIVANLTATYPRNVISINTDSSEWLLNNAGGAMGAMYIIHASITEYLIIFGTPLGTEGHTGLHTADDYFHILTGEQWAFDPSKSLKMEVYGPGSVHVLPRGYAKQYKMHEGCFALEYARGRSCVPLFVCAVSDDVGAHLQAGFR